MIVHGGVAPFIEEPNPRFGEVIKTLNELAYFIERKTISYNETTRERLVELSESLNSFVTDVIIPIDAHLNSTGAVHGETKATIGLPLKDNYRAATLAEQLALSPVDAFVTAQGAKASVTQNNQKYTAANYQSNGVLQMASYYYADSYPVLVPSRPEPVRYMSTSSGRYVTTLLNADRLVLYPFQDASYERKSLFVSGPTKVGLKTQLEEVQNVTDGLFGFGWNLTAARNSSGKVNFFHPIADKDIYEFKNNLNMPDTKSSAYLLYRGYGSTVYKGLAVASVRNGNHQFSIHHTAFQVNALETDPVLNVEGPAGYPAAFSVMGGTTFGYLNGSHSYDVTNFLTLPANATVSIASDDDGISTSLFWNVQDYEAYLFVALNLVVTIPGVLTKRVTLRFLESIIPGTLVNGGGASFTTVGTLVKDVIPNTLVPPADAKWTETADLFNMHSPSYQPGAMLSTGEVLKAANTKYGLRVKRLPTSFKSFKEWVLGPRVATPVSDALTEVAVPARHNTFTALPDRIIPFYHTASEVRYLAYGLNARTGKYQWYELVWFNGMISTEANGKFGIRAPDSVIPRSTGLNDLPTSVSAYMSAVADGVSYNALAFTATNGYKGYQTINYVSGTLGLGAVISLAPGSLVQLQGFGGDILKRAAAVNPAVNNSLRKTQIMVFALASNKAVYVISDGLGYAEAGVAPYNINNGVFTLDFSGVGGVKLTAVTGGTGAQPGVSRESLSGDDPEMEYSDLMAYQRDVNTYSVVINRPYGNLHGSLSFEITGFLQAVPTLVPSINNKARLYQGVNVIDAVDELYPSFVISRKGLYTVDPTAIALNSTKMISSPDGTVSVDPFDVNEAGWVYVPAGAKVIINGTGYILAQAYGVKTNPNGVTYCYLTRAGDGLGTLASDVIRETSNMEVLFGVATNGVLEVSQNYLVIDNHLISNTHRGSAVPFFEDNGGDGVNRFFTQRDRI